MGADYLRTNFSGGGLVSVAFGQGDAGAGTASTISVPPTPLITQVFATGQSNTTNSAEHRFTFSPIGEWRFGGRFRISKSVSFNFGYTGMWLSQIARASTNTAFVTRFKRSPIATQNLTAQLASNDPTDPAAITSEGFTAVVDQSNRLVSNYPGSNGGYIPNSAAAGVGAEFQTVPPTIQVRDAQGQQTIVRNPRQFVGEEFTAYTQQNPDVGGQEYVLTNGIDFGIEIKY